MTVSGHVRGYDSIAPNSPRAQNLFCIVSIKKEYKMKQESNDKDSKNLELMPHTKSSCGYALPLVEGEQSPKNEGALNLSVKNDYHINKVSDGFTFCKYRFYRSFVSVRAEIHRRAIRAKRRGQQHYAGYKGMLLKTDSKHLRDLIENNYMELVNRHGMTITTQKGDKVKLRDIDERSTIIPYEYKILQSKAALADGKPAKYHVQLVYILTDKDGKHRLCNSTEGSEEIVQFFKLADINKVTARQVLHVRHRGNQSYFEEYHMTKEEACDIICDELGIS